jgi:hypothetical protein
VALERSSLMLAQSTKRVQRRFLLKLFFVQFVFQLVYPSTNDSIKSSEFTLAIPGGSNKTSHSKPSVIPG